MAVLKAQSRETVRIGRRSVELSRWVSPTKGEFFNVSVKCKDQSGGLGFMVFQQKLAVAETREAALALAEKNLKAGVDFGGTPLS